MTSLVDLLKSKPGVQGGVGRRAVSAALAKGYTKDQIEAAGNTIKAEAAAGTYTGQTSGFDEAFSRIGEKDSSYFGDVDPEAFRDESGDIDVDAYHAQQDKHAGGADTASMRIGGQSWTDIENYMSGTGVTNPNHPSSSAQGASAYSKMLDRIGVGADLEAEQAKNTKQAGQISTLTGNYNTLQGHYDALQGKYADMGKQYTNLQADVAQAAKDAMKIKYTGSTAVQNPSAMGIQAAQGTPFRGSGLAGTAALARPNKGMKIQTLNV